MNNKETLLIVEDNQVLREGLREMLTFEGYSVLTAANGREALTQMEQINSIAPSAGLDLILSDITMPEMDGFAFFKTIRSRVEWVTIPFIFLTARGEKEDVLAGKNLGAEDYLVKPLTREELVAAVRGRLVRSRQIRMAQLQQAYEASLTALANAIDVRDEYTRHHVERVTAYAQILAENMGWNENRLEQLRFGTILHDIGKIFIRDITLNKIPPLTQEEWEEIKRHPLDGAEMLKDIPYLASAVPVVRYHHEHWNGRGYPDKLAGESIPVEARIVAVADALDAMTTARSYRPMFTLQEAYQEILNCSGSQFDPQVVAAFEKAWEQEQIQTIIALWEND
jgi:putative two-component system response regulator